MRRQLLDDHRRPGGRGSPLRRVVGVHRGRALDRRSPAPAVRPGQPFFGLIFDSRLVVPDAQNPASDPGDLRGGFRSSRRFIGWQTFFDFGSAFTAQVKPHKVIDTVLSTPLFALPVSAIAHIPGAPGPTALPQRTGFGSSPDLCRPVRRSRDGWE